MPPRRTRVDRRRSRAESRSTAAFSVALAASASGSRPVDLLGQLGDRAAPWASMPTASITPSGPRPSVSSRTIVGDVRRARRSRSPRRRCGGPSPAARARGRRRSPSRRPGAGDPGAHLPDRAEAEDGDAAALRDRRVLDRLPGGGQHVGEEEEALVRGAVSGTLIGPKCACGTRRYSAWPPGTWP